MSKLPPFIARLALTQ